MFVRGQVVISKAGRDKGYLMAVSDYDGTNVYVCDGKERRIKTPKKKNPCHIEITGLTIGEERMRSDSALRKALAKIRSEIL